MPQPSLHTGLAVGARGVYSSGHQRSRKIRQSRMHRICAMLPPCCPHCGSCQSHCGRFRAAFVRGRCAPVLRHCCRSILRTVCTALELLPAMERGDQEVFLRLPSGVAVGTVDLPSVVRSSSSSLPAEARRRARTRAVHVRGGEPDPAAARSGRRTGHGAHGREGKPRERRQLHCTGGSSPIPTSRRSVIHIRTPRLPTLHGRRHESPGPSG